MHKRAILLNKSGGVTKNILCANRLQVATVLATSVPSPYTSRRSHYASPQGAISNLQFVDAAFYISGSFVPASPASGYTIKKYVEYPAGVFTQVTWGGAPSVFVPVGGAVIKSDPVPVTIPAGTRFWERTVHISGTAHDMPAIQLPAVPSSLGVQDGNVAADQGNSGTITTSTSSITSIGSVAIVGTVASANARAFVIWGDSIAFGQADVSSSGVKGGSGYIARALDPLYPSMKIAMPGSAAFNYVSNNAPYLTLLQAIGYTDVICEHGGGDLRQGRTPAQILSNLQTIYGLNPGKRIYQSTLLSRTDSTDGWASVANQTPKTDGLWAQLSTLNDAIRLPQTGVTGVIEAADLSMTARNSGIWPAPPVPVPDGVHPNSYMAALLAAAVAPAVG